MTNVFSKTNFKENAPADIKRKIPQSHLDVLDGMEVIFNDDDKYGLIMRYKVPEDDRAEDFMLYPVFKDWCSGREQMSLFD
ncbi:hypothetical protein [Oceanobacillus oncorhynchi]|uniref:hypothetical protein n=1 Tax=Oceanobacillus oncorhynchi TaxID=545501 RepID=UPI0025A4BCA7|nr:hypothetical protein [Oceanobacillus oncorhynchi]MDM8098681.1 hypothetical protein [Oceanobacillus oncorhynchi]